MKQSDFMYAFNKDNSALLAIQKIGKNQMANILWKIWSGDSKKQGSWFLNYESFPYYGVLENKRLSLVDRAYRQAIGLSDVIVSVTIDVPSIKNQSTGTVLLHNATDTIGFLDFCCLMRNAIAHGSIGIDDRNVVIANKSSRQDDISFSFKIRGTIESYFKKWELFASHLLSMSTMREIMSFCLTTLNCESIRHGELGIFFNYEIDNSSWSFYMPLSIEGTSAAKREELAHLWSSDDITNEIIVFANSIKESLGSRNWLSIDELIGFSDGCLNIHDFHLFIERVLR